jgi:menaquinone-9 beta-reductase
VIDVFVIGGGPAGLAAAIAARKKGFDVTVADGGQPPLEKPCGEGMMPGTLEVLHDLGIHISAADGFAFSGIRFVSGNAQVQGCFPNGLGLGMRRLLLHQRMVEAAHSCGVHFLWNTTVSGILPEGVVAGKDIVPARWIIGADGSRSLVRRWSGLDAIKHYGQRFARRRHYAVQPWSDFMEIYWGRHIQAYVTPVADREVCVVLMSHRRQILWEEAGKEFPILAERLDKTAMTSAERGTVTARYSLERVYRGCVALIGDASGGVDAITGEGLRLGFRQALALAEAMAVNDLSQFQAAHRQLARRPTRMGRLMLLLGRHAPLRQRAIRALSSHPEIFAQLLAIHLGETSATHLATTAAMLSWRLLAA